MQEFDLIVIGAGTGLDVANAAAEQGLKVAVIEKDKMGGTCLNRGCIPSKLLIHSADVIDTIKKASLFGINVDGYSVDFEKIMERVNGTTDTESDEIKENLLNVENPKLFARECTFIGKKRIVFKNSKKDNIEHIPEGTQGLGSKERIIGNGIGNINSNSNNNDNKSNEDHDNNITSKTILIASGTRPSIPKIPGLEGSGYITSDEALRLKKQPQAITFIGGGYITCELAHFFGSLGSQINIIQRGDLLIKNEDIDIATRFTSIFSKKYNVYLGYNPEFVSKTVDSSNNAMENFHVTAKNKEGKVIKVDSDQLIVATGRIPNTPLLNLDKTGVDTDEKGFILVNKYLETSAPGIFALGDVVGKYQLKHSANLEARYTFFNILNKFHGHDKDKLPVDYTAMPHAIFTSPQIAGVGYTEQELQKKNNIKYFKSLYPFFNTGMGKAIEDQEGFVKFLVDKDSRKILGCHIMGTDASTLIHEVLVTMRTGRGLIDDITNTVHIHPALSEVIDRAAGEIDS